MSDTQTPDPFDSYMAARLAKPVAQVAAALDADEAQPVEQDCRHCARVIVLTGVPRAWRVSASDPDVLTMCDTAYCGSESGGRHEPAAVLPAYTPEREAQPEKDASCRTATERVFAFIDAANRP